MSDQAQQGPAKPAPSLYDIGAFLSGGLNMDEAQAKNMLMSLRSRMAAADLERDQGDTAEIEYDILCDIVEMAERLLAMWGDDTHVLVMGKDRWAIEHSLRCRATMHMAECPFHRAIEGPGNLPFPGRWRIVLDDDQTAWTELVPLS